MPIKLYIGNLPKELERQELESVFAEFDSSISPKLITDRKTGKCRGFGFVTVKSDEQADQLIEKFNGYPFKENALVVERAQPRNKGKGEEDEKSEKPATPTSGGAAASSGGGNSPGSNRRKGGNKAAKKATAEPESVQPDPRWASELEKLKQLLAAQTTNP
jgi:RNA recognition motif-containing protein